MVNAEWKTEVFERVLKIGIFSSGLLLVVTLLLSYFEVLPFPLELPFVHMFGIWGLTSLLPVLTRGTRYRALVFSLLLTIMALVAIYTMGPRPAPIIIMTLAMMIAAIFVGFDGAILIMSLSAIGITAVGWLFANGTFGGEAGMLFASTTLQEFVTMSIAFALLNIIILSILQNVVRTVDSTISEIQAARTALETSHEKSDRLTHLYSLISSNSSDVIVELNTSLQPIFVSPSVEQLLGFTPEEFSPVVTRLLITTNHFRNLESNPRISNPSENGIIHKYYSVLPSKDGSRKICEIVIARLDASNENLVVSIHDVSHQIALQDQISHAESQKALGQLASGIAHDFNNILSVIQGNVELLELHPEEQSQTIATIMQATDRASDLTQQILDYTRKQSIDFHYVDVIDVLTETTEMFRRTCPTNITIESNILEQRAPIAGDHSRLSQVFLNICLNAKDAMPEGGTLTINLMLTHPQVGSPSEVQISFSDTGIGMEPAQVKRIFEPYFTTKTPGEGTGLGLSTTKSIVEQHNGSLSVDSKIDDGTVFTVTFPIVDAMAEDDTPSETTTNLPSLTILIAEDNAELLALLKKSLQSQGHTVITAINGLEAYERFIEHTIDIVVSDVNMPDGNGLELLEKVKGTPIVLISGYLSASQNEQVPEGVQILYKPFKISQLIDCIAIARNS